MDEAALAAQDAEFAALNARCAANPREAANFAALLRRTPRAMKEQWLLNSALNNHATLVRLLLADGLSPNTVYPEYANSSVLHVAAQHGANDVVRLLLEAGANTNCSDAVGITPLANAVCKGQLACARELIPHTNLRIFSADGKNALHKSIIANLPSPSSCCCLTSRTTSMCAPPSHVPLVTLASRTTPRHYCLRARVGITPW